MIPEDQVQTTIDIDKLYQLWQQLTEVDYLPLVILF